MIGIRQKLTLGFGVLLVIMLVSQGITLFNLNKLGGSVNTVLQENYGSVAASQQMIEALERVDRGLLLILAGNEPEGLGSIPSNVRAFKDALAAENSNITLPGEKEAAEETGALFAEYTAALKRIIDADNSEMKKQIYYSELYPNFIKTKNSVLKILDMNQSYMSESGRNTAELSDKIFGRTLTAIISAFIIAALFSFLVQKWIFRPLMRLIESTKQIKDGDFNLFLEVKSSDEVGQLSESFNSMAQSLRLHNQQNIKKMERAERSAVEMLKVLPEAVAIIGADGVVKSASLSAERDFGFKTGEIINFGLEWASELYSKCLMEQKQQTYERFIQHFKDGEEYFFQSTAIPVPPETGSESVSVMLVIKDVTQLNEQKELKKSVVATISHQLKTPLTSVRMAIHLLLEEKVGSLNEKQTELLLEAREGSDRLVSIIDSLLSINISANGKLSTAAVSPDSLIDSAEMIFSADAKDRGIELSCIRDGSLADVLADKDAVSHVFVNLISNSLRFTPPGGRITVSAREDGEFVCFAVRDTGYGISKEHLEHIFERFYRVPGQAGGSGTGLGLTIVKEIITAHGGQVAAESAEGTGTEFSFTLPVVKEEHK